jgi:hypothetical protein
MMPGVDTPSLSSVRERQSTVEWRTGDQAAASAVYQHLLVEDVLAGT